MNTDLVVTKDNKLIQSFGFELSLYEQRVLLLCIAKMDSRKKPPCNTFTLHVDEFHQELGLSKKAVYDYLDDAICRLFERSIYLDPNERKSKMRWLMRKEYKTGQGQITISFTPEVMTYLSDLKSRFTSYKLKHVSRFKSAYSFRFYELFCSWNGRQELKLEVAWIRQALELGDKYQDISDLKKNVIIPALDDINSSSDLNVTFTQVKIGKFITHFIFTYVPKNPVKKPKKLTHAFIEKNARPGETWQQAHDRLKNDNLKYG